MNDAAPFPSYDAALDWLYSTQLFGIKLGLETTRRLITVLEAWPAEGVDILHVAGTNGKGSVCAFLDRLFREDGHSVGVFTSPHLVEFTERFRIDGGQIPRETVTALISEIRNATKDWETSPTFFEMVTAMALAWFKRQGVGVIILETGMGGRLDSTNAVPSTISIITRVDLDHQKWLGETLAEIAREKAGIMKPGVPVLSVPQAPEAMEVLEEMARRKGSPLSVITQPYEGPVGLAGSHQLIHAALAAAAWQRSMGAELGETQKAALAGTHLDGRFHPLTRAGAPADLAQADYILDGAHNPAAARRLVKTWREIYGDERAILVCGALGDKDADAMVRELGVITDLIFPAPVNNPRARTQQEMAWTIQRYAPGKLAPECVWEDAGTVGHLLERAATYLDAQGRRYRILVTGSLFLVGEALAHLTKSASPRKSAQ